VHNAAENGRRMEEDDGGDDNDDDFGGGGDCGDKVEFHLDLTFILDESPTTRWDPRSWTVPSKRGPP
jgi:hypothetical protein